MKKHVKDNVPIISVIIPAYNAETSINVCIESVLNQTMPSKEIIVINDGSTDGTADIACSHGSKVIYLEQENKGQGAARNAGLSIAKGKYVAFLDADDYWLPTFLEKCTAFLAVHKDAVAVSTGLIIQLFGQKRKIVSFPQDGDQAPGMPYMIDNFFDFWAKNDHVRTGSNVIRRKVIDQAGFQRADLRISQDLEYWALIATYGRWGYIPEPLWVGNSRNVAASSGWFKKYALRRKMCPTVESWQERVISRLKERDWRGFEILRGKVALSFAHTKILTGNYKEAYRIIQTYGNTMPLNKMSRLMKMGVRMRLPGFCLVAWTLILKEYAKELGIR